ncbi:MAG: Transcriptional regulatorGntR family domain Aspartate aminotransferase [Anaerocolumna sp.]|jgi:GntR family transcriptional regulator of abcA and norABC|nr:Transcriptional regulatorGntR family domain Aspartate aminotransferase [Anaerocolumna sp.]
MNLTWKPDKISKIPAYIQIIDYVKSKIESGEWCIGDKIPPQRELAEQFLVNRSTVVSAINELIAGGMLEGRGCKGTVIINNTWSLLTSRSYGYWNSYIEGGLHMPNQQMIRDIVRIKHSKDIVRLGTGELSPALYPKERISEIIKNALPKINSLGYEEPKGMLHLRIQVSHYLKGIGVNVSPDCIMIVSGGIQALQLIAMGILPKDTNIYLEEPSYMFSLNILQSTGMSMVGLNMDNEGLVINELIKSSNVKGNSMLYTIPTFHNPTGILMSEQRRKDLMNANQQFRIPIIEDDIYREIWFDEPPPKPLKSLDNNGDVLYIGSISKTLSSGMRIGWIVGPEQVINRLADIKMQTDYGASSFSQWIVAECMVSGFYNEYTGEIRAELRKRRDICLECLERYFKNIATWNVPKGGYYIWLKVEKNIAIKEIFNRALDKGILLKPGNVYQRKDNKYLRISYSYANLNELEDSLKKLADVIKVSN